MTEYYYNFVPLVT